MTDLGVCVQLAVDVACPACRGIGAQREGHGPRAASGPRSLTTTTMASGAGVVVLR
eukprot:CAMPEP_0198421002 /NCGR_PEP_ID=MMETSP1452-20131203/1329_1 /TAXON_ID=1181717 /ORGANISM="Synchroma pusillum, Strain CCMP3072" /LENGTH=55 /DNA_ID=CAMNT_0044141189 /DNA_START=67 /DNA_END=235 /DNA_ORIENTATION=+